ncbi:hypothetical protein B0H16DRAFT_1731452 [Mycena metata]|uniref:Uncharacterized protein n=1 Tax=Mycena metata TaxID=1033252 RepID=A0AAD7I4Z4_9AGAR|nr:hypothetical protein B0H16DRAFT_1731452 [Mycena metata]
MFQRCAPVPLYTVCLHQHTDKELLVSRTQNKNDVLVSTLIEHRKLSSHGIRATTIGSAVDTRSLVFNVQDEVRTTLLSFLEELVWRTGTCGFAFLTCGHIGDTFLPTFAGSGDAIDFCLEVLKTPAMDILWQFEQWALTRQQNKPPPNNLRAVCKQITAALEDGLCKITQQDKMRMSYMHFKVDIQQRWRVKVVGWPTNIPFENPSKIGKVDILRTIRDELCAGLIYWEALTPPERSLAAHAPTSGGKHVSAGRRDDEPSDEDEEDEEDDETDDERHGEDEEAGDARASSGVGFVTIPPASLGNTTTTTPLGGSTNSTGGTANAPTDGATAFTSTTTLPMPLGDSTNMSTGGATTRKRKATTLAGNPPKKPRVPRVPKSAAAGGANAPPRKTRSDTSKPRGPRNSAGVVSASASGSSGAGGKRNDATTQAVKAKMQAQRTATSLSAQLPPRAV